MVLTDDSETLYNDGLLNFFDSVTHGAWGTGTASIDVGNTTLNNEIYRNIIESATKNLSAGTYDIEFRIPATQANGETITEVAVFDASTGGNLFVAHLPTSATFGLEEVWIKLKITVVISQ